MAGVEKEVRSLHAADKRRERAALPVREKKKAEVGGANPGYQLIRDWAILSCIVYRHGGKDRRSLCTG